MKNIADNVKPFATLVKRAQSKKATPADFKQQPQVQEHLNAGLIDSRRYVSAHELI
jgi:hypothetical protein